MIIQITNGDNVTFLDTELIQSRNKEVVGLRSEVLNLREQLRKAENIAVDGIIELDKLRPEVLKLREKLCHTTSSKIACESTNQLRLQIISLKDDNDRLKDALMKISTHATRSANNE